MEKHLQVHEPGHYCQMIELERQLLQSVICKDAIGKDDTCRQIGVQSGQHMQLLQAPVSRRNYECGWAKVRTAALNAYDS
jgi:hypothetical protein